MEYLNQLTRLDFSYPWIVQVFLVVLLALIVDFVLRRVIRRLRTGALATRSPWDEALLDTVQPPLSLLIWVVGLGLAGQIILQSTGTLLFEATESIRDVGVIGALSWFLIRLTRRVQTIYVERHKDDADTIIDASTAEALGKLVRLAIVITSVLVVLQTLGYSVSGILAFGGIGGIAVGFAARDLLANFFGAIMIYLDRPFSIGDWVRSPDRNIEGTVEEIGWRLSRVRTFDKRPLYVPNSIFTSIIVENPSRMNNRRIYETIGLRYGDIESLDRIVTEVRQMLREHPEIDPDQTLIVNFDKFADSSLNFFVYTFTRTTQWVHFHEVKQDVLLRIAAIIEANGAEIAFPSRSLYFADSSAPVRFEPAMRGASGGE